MQTVAKMYLSGEGTSKDENKAAFWALKAAEAGDLEAMKQIAGHYYDGVGVKQDIRESIRWHSKAAELGDPKSMICMAYCYDNGTGVRKDSVKAMEWVRRAADKGVIPAISNVGMAYATGRGVPENDFLAYAWLSLATAKGAEDSLSLRNEVRARLSPEMVVKAQQLTQYWFENGTEEKKNIVNEKEASRGGDDMPRGSGTGFFVTADGYLLTAAHVIEKAKQIKVTINGGTHVAQVISIDDRNDIALLKVTGTFKAIPIIPSQETKLGTDVFTIGFPNIDLQGRNPKFTKGVVSGLSGLQDDPTCFQISVAVQPGNSGGPLVNTEGYVVGIIVSKLDDIATAKHTGSIPQSVNYAIKSTYATPLLAMIPKGSERPIIIPRKTLDQAVSQVESSVCIILVY